MRERTPNTVGERLAAVTSECLALRVEVRMLMVELYREQRMRREREERDAREADTVLEEAPA
jgi:hypothetical protein